MHVAQKYVICVWTVKWQFHEITALNRRANNIKLFKSFLQFFSSLGSPLIKVHSHKFVPRIYLETSTEPQKVVLSHH